MTDKNKKKPKEEIQFEAKLPQGISLSSVSGIVVPTEEAGNVCQFFEFCLAFGKVMVICSIQLVYEQMICNSDSVLNFFFLIGS